MGFIFNISENSFQNPGQVFVIQALFKMLVGDRMKYMTIHKCTPNKYLSHSLES